MEDRFSRLVPLFGEDGLEKLKNARVAVFGLGGVGGHLAEALVRGGVGSLDLIDADVVSESNLNRQLVATSSAIGKAKVEILRDRLLDINPNASITPRRVFFKPDTADLFDFSAYDYIADAIDSVTGKLELVLKAKEAGVPIISAMGAGNKLDASAFRVADISKTKVCPLARVMRVELRKRGVTHLKVVYSEEEPRKGVPGQDKSHPLPSSASFVPPVMGLIMAGEILKDLSGVNADN